jgi:hypothetical protein
MKLASPLRRERRPEGLGDPLGCSATLRNTRSKLGLGSSALTSRAMSMKRFDFLWIVGRWFGLAGHAEKIMSSDNERKSGPLVWCSEEELERCAAIFEVRYVDGTRICIGPRRGRNVEPSPQQLAPVASN